MSNNTGAKDKLFLPGSFDGQPYCVAMLKAVYKGDGTIADFEFVAIDPKQDLVGKKIGELYPDADHSSFIDHCRQVITTGKPYEGEAWHSTWPKPYWFCVRIHKLLEELVITTEDITRRKQIDADLTHAEDELALLAAEKYAQILHNMPIAFCIIEVLFDEHHEAIDYIFLETNLAFAKHTTLTHPEGKSMLELEPRHEKDWFRKYGNVIKTRKYAHFIADAKPLGNYVYETWAMPLSPKAGNQVAVFFNDITERIDDQITLHEMVDKYHKLLADLGHDFEQ